MSSLLITGTFSPSFTERDLETLQKDVESNKVSLGAGVHLPGRCAYKDNTPKPFCSISSEDLGLGEQSRYADVYTALTQQGGQALYWSDQFRLALPGVLEPLSGCAILLLERPFILNGEPCLPALHFGEQLHLQPIRLSAPMTWPKEVYWVCAV